MTTQNIINFFRDEHTRVALACIVAGIGYFYPSLSSLCNLLATFLGVSVGITIAKSAIVAASNVVVKQG